MYKPAPRRPKKTSIVRTRTGCITCRERRKKCDEKRPACTTCVRLGKRCEKYKTGYNFRNVSFVAGTTPETETQVVQVTKGNRGPRVCSPGGDVQPTPSGSTPVGNTQPSTPSSTEHEEDNTAFSSEPVVQAENDAGTSANNDPLLGDGFALWVGDLDNGVSQSGHIPTILGSIPATHDGTLPVGDSIGSALDNDWHRPQDHHKDDAQALLSNAFHNLFEPGIGQTFDESTLVTTEPVLMADDGATGYTSIIPYQIPRTPTLFSVPGQQVVYMDFWLDQCLPALHPIFKDFPALGTLPQIVTDTMMALSAGRLSRLLPQPKSFGVRDVPGLSFRPDATHKTSSQKYYYSALRGIYEWVQQSKESQSPITLAVLVLFCCWESSMGNFRDFAIHSSGATKLIQAQENALIQQGSLGYGLMAAWVRARMNNWWRRMHFSTVDFQRKQAPVSIEPHVEMVLDLAGDSKASVLVILCESLRIYSSAVVDYWNSGAASSPGGNACLYPYTLLMKTQSKKLSTWHTKVSLANLPIASFPSAAPPVARDGASLKVEPLHFQTHDSAMNYAYYVTARIIQTGSLTRTHSCKAEPVTQEAEQWVFILLRIAAGIDWEACIRLNTYAIGFSGLLLVCAIHSSNLAVGLWIQDWLEERQSTSHLEEGSFPVLQILQVLRAVNNERAGGRDVYAVFQTVDDGGGEGKFHSYHSQTLTSVMVYGRNNESKELLSYSIPV
ncbi:hypothetical protein FALBO_16918 [Fusarium albosuccineum]|uniref:Zn(2)-C6 fungal-type domain-containing protein n=1 Tax=Fusarium albosuccineum TaxID=1237068 RepID=A0A8H4KD60_9HYPO|nr:hypothetical protein FALBO_16918 [Fusarium albosuccineum]